MSAQKVHPRVIIGLVLILLGGAFILDNYNILDFSLPYYIFDWRNILIAIGVIVLISAAHKTTGLVLIGIGTWGHFPELWPLILIGVGVVIIMRRNDSRKHIFSKCNFEGSRTEANIEDDKIDDVSIFGGGKKRYETDNFKGGKITAIFGGSEIDLTKCKLAEGENDIDILAIFGGSTLLIPNDWKIVVDLVPIFGGFSDSRRKDPNMVPRDDRVLYIKGLVLFGGGEIKSY